MLRYVIAILLMMLIVGCNQQQEQKLLSENEFTEAYIAKLSAKEPKLSIERKDSLELVVHDSSDNHLRIYLGNAYKSYQQSPESRDNILEDFVQSMLETMRASGNDEEIDVKRIVPVIKDTDYLAGVKKSLGEAAKDPEKFDIYYETLNKDLLVFYVVDSEHNLKFLGQKELDQLKIKGTELRQLSLTNLETILPEIKKHGDGGTFMVTAGGTYEASLLLMETLWSRDNFEVRGDIVVSVPSRDLLLVTGSKDSEGLARIREIAQQTMSEGGYTLTDQLFVRKDGKWVRFK